MSNNYYAGNVIYNNQHKELTIQGNLSAQQMMKIEKFLLKKQRWRRRITRQR